jgi:hypothetical protein
MYWFVADKTMVYIVAIYQHTSKNIEDISIIIYPA